MTYFWDQLDFLAGGRFTGLAYRHAQEWPDELDDETVLLGNFVGLPPGQHVDVEMDFLNSHLPYWRAAFGGSDGDGDPWLFVIQDVPRSVAGVAFGPGTDPFDVMHRALSVALAFNAEARQGVEFHWARDDLTDVYGEEGIDASSISGWSTQDLLRGLLTELTGAELTDIVAGYPECAFPNRPHACQHDVFDDVFTDWSANQDGVPR